MKARLLLIIAPALLLAQDTGTSTTIYVPNYTEVKQYLSLSDAQLQSLQTIGNNRSQAQANIYNQISQKYQALYALLEAGTGTAPQLGQFLMDIQNLQKQLPLIDGPYKAQAQNVLTAEQKARLAKLSEALQLQATASEAAGLLLIDFPQWRGPIAFAGTGDSATGVGLPTPTNLMIAPAVAAPHHRAIVPLIR